MLNGIEKKILEELAKRQVMREEEVASVAGSGYKHALQRLIQLGLVSYVFTGTPCYVITKEGIRSLS